MKPEETHEPEKLDLSNKSDWKIYQWPEEDGSISIKLDIEIRNGLIFPIPPEGMQGSYIIPDHVSAWGWSNEINTWNKLHRIGEFSQEFAYITFTLLNNTSVATANIILFCPIPMSEEDLIESFPPYVKASGHESVIPDLTGHYSPEKVHITDCKTVRNLTIHGCGDATVIVNINTPLMPLLGLHTILVEAGACALQLATIRAQKRLIINKELIAKNTECPSECSFPIIISGDISPDFDFEYDIKIDKDKKVLFYIIARGQLLEKVKIKCKGAN